MLQLSLSFKKFSQKKFENLLMTGKANFRTFLPLNFSNFRLKWFERP